MMNKRRLMKWFLFLVLLANVNAINAQNNTIANQSLNGEQQSIATISALTAVGDLEQLKTQLNTGLDAGLTVSEIKEMLVQLYAYCGFPRSLNSISTFMTVLDERKAKGITDKQGKEVAVVNDSTGKYERGRKVLEQLTRTPQAKPAPGFGEFSPRIDTFLKEHLFADVFDSEVLNYQQRELITISALAAMSGVEAQLKSHVAIGINTGITENQLMQVAGLIEKHISKTQANSLRKLLSKSIVPVIEPDMIVRISEIEIVPEYLEEYKSILKQEAVASVKIEPGVIAIFPMYQQENPNQIRIIEIYANKAAYQSHIKTPHFLHYKTSTLKMVKGLKLVDMQSIDPETMLEIFKKLR
jgi:alkylhydroperoxidase/carboxymuconolactone decarboxylase family protein YurZ/quinol monooxygenase YgiN